ncbi:MAG: efflux RND transporter permease subunit [Gemmatimonadota bacterium]|nr:efflux RND transporter permease subunit [Gemmatimonadota bacterium]
MFISDFAIKKPIVTITVMVALVAFGIFALFSLQTDEFPDVQQPVVVVNIPYPGASPDVVEREVIEPIEEQIFGIAGVDGSKSTSVATDGLARMTIFFDFEKDINQASQDIRDAISAKRADLPTEMKEPMLSRLDPSIEPAVSLTLSSTSLPATVLTRLADPTITRQLRAIPGVAQVNVVGGIKRELTVQVKPVQLQASGISVAQVVAALEAQNLAVPVGRLNGSLDERTIRLRGRLEGPADFANVVIAERNGTSIRLGQVADVLDGAEEPRSLALYNDKEAIGIEVLKSKGYSTTQVSNKIRDRVIALQKTLPPAAKLEIVRDAGTRVSHAVQNVEEALVEGALLTVLVVFLFLNSWRSTVITGLALPVSVLASFIPLWIFGFTLNTMSLMGLSLAIGILIDDAIVVRENIVRHIEMGKDHFVASHDGTDEIGLAVAATTFSIVAVFVPIAFMYGVGGQWFKPFALTIAAAVLVSLFVSFSLDPMLSAYWADPQVEAHEHRNPIARTLERFNKWFDRQADRYKNVIAWALDHRLAMVALATLSFVGAIALQVKYGKGGFVPVSDRSELNFVVEAPPGSNLEYMRIKADEAARIARSHKEVAYTYATIGTAIPPFEPPGVDQSLIYVRLTPKSSRSLSQDDIGQLLRKELGRIGGAQVSVFTSGFGGAMKQIQIQMSGQDAATLTKLAQQAADEVRKVPGAVDVGLSTRGEKPEMEIQLNRGLSGSLGVTVGQVAQSLRPAFAGIKAGDWVDPSGETRDVTVRLAPESRSRLADLQQLPLIVGNGANGAPATVPLGQVATIKQGLGPALIAHLNRERVINVEANTEGRSLSEVVNDINTRLNKMQLPPGYQITQGGESRDQGEVFGRIFAALGTAVMLMYLILVIQFGSFLAPLAILVSLPLSLIGVVLMLMATGDSINIMSLIGVILLMGIVAKNAILLIDFAKWGQERGVERREAIIEAGRIRLRPILMTTLALIAGMIPVALGRGEGADFRAPLGRAVIGGVITSTLLTLLVIPTIYEILDEWREKLTGFVKRRIGVNEPASSHKPVPEAGD